MTDETGAAPPITVLVVDDHAILRQALGMMLTADPGITVVADVATGREAVEAATEHMPDIVLMDIMMPGLNGFEATRQILQRSPASQVIVLSAFAERRQLIESVRAGATGYVLKRSDPSELVTAIKTVFGGERYYSEELTREFRMDEIDAEAGHIIEGRTGPDSLTAREREVLQLIAEGGTNQKIGDHLNISVKTVEAHVAHIMTKLNSRNRTELIRHAMNTGLVQIESAAEVERQIARSSDNAAIA